MTNKDLNIEELAKSAIDLGDEVLLKSLLDKHSFTFINLNVCLSYAIEKKIDSLVNLILDKLQERDISEFHPLEEPIKEPIKEPVKEVVEEAKESVKEPVKEILEEGPKEPVEEPVKEVVEEPVKEVVEEQEGEKEEPDILAPLKEWVNEIFEKYCKMNKKYIKQNALKKAMRKHTLEALHGLVNDEDWNIILFLSGSGRYMEDYDLYGKSVIVKMSEEQRKYELEITLKKIFEDDIDEFSEGMTSLLLTGSESLKHLGDNFSNYKLENSIVESFVDLILKNIDSIESWVD